MLVIIIERALSFSSIIHQYQKLLLHALITIIFRHVLFLALVALKLLVSLISRLVACSARIVADKQTHRTTTVIG